MQPLRSLKHDQRGVFLIEALIAILIFSIGVLGVVALGTSALAAQTDAQYRTRAAALANEMASNIALNVDRTSNSAALRTSLAVFAHQPSPGGNCTFTGDASTSPLVTAWVAKVKDVTQGGLPGSDDAGMHIAVNTDAATGFNRVEITLCWQAPKDKARRSHTLVSFVNGSASK